MTYAKKILAKAGVFLAVTILVFTSVAIVPLKAVQRSDHDVGVTEILSPTTGPVQSYPVEVTVENFGTNAESYFPVEVIIETGEGTVVYDQTVYVSSINPGESMNVSCPEWYPSGYGEYQVTACTQLDTDENPSNNCYTVVFYIAINIFGFNHIPLGDALLNIVNGTLVVSNIGPSGDDGVQVLLPNDLVSLRPELELGTQDMSLELTSKGIVNGVPGQVATVIGMDLTNGGKNIAMTFNASALQPQYIMAHYYTNGSPMPVKSEKIPISGGNIPTWQIALGAAESLRVEVEAIPAETVAVHTDVEVLSNSGPYSQSLSNMEDNGICGGMDLDGNKGNVSTPNGNETEVEAIWFYTQNCTFQLQNYTDLSMTGKSSTPTPISMTVADEKAVTTQTRPTLPEMTGPMSGRINKKCDYNVSATDPQGGNVYYWVYWGCDESVGWLGPYTSGAIEQVSFTWTHKNHYVIGVLAKNIDGFESGWKALTIAMPYVPHHWFWQFLLNHPNAFPILRHLLGL